MICSTIILLCVQRLPVHTLPRSALNCSASRTFGIGRCQPGYACDECAARRIRPHEAHGSRKPQLIPLDDALRPAGRLEVITDLRRLIRRAERTGECPIIYALFAEDRTRFTTSDCEPSTLGYLPCSAR